MFDLLATPVRRRFLFFSLYMSEGAPVGFIWWALPTKLRAADVPIDEITLLTAILVLPWTFKFLWAPLVDVLQSSRWSLRHWICAAQVAMGATLIPLLWLDYRADFALLGVVLVLHALAAATQDVAIDALCIAAVEPAERGRINGWMQAGMLLGRAALGGGALVLSAKLGDAAVIGLLIAVSTWSLVLILSMTAPPPPGGSEGGIRRRLAGFAGNLAVAAGQRSTWIGILFAASSGAGFEAVGAVVGPFLTDRGLAESEIGWFFAVPVIVCSIAGSLSGGWLADRIGHRRAVVLSQSLIVAAILSLAITDEAWGRDSPLAALSLLAAMYFGVGLFVASTYALLMDLTSPAVAATQFSAMMGATNACEAWSAWTVGRLIVGWGYPGSFVVMAAVSVLALLPLLVLGKAAESCSGSGDRSP